MYPCHRTQPRDDFKYGNIFADGMQFIVNNAPKVISQQENKTSISKDCLSCNHFHHCQLNCTLIRRETLQDKSYTCALQKKIYADQPNRFKALKDEERNSFIFDFIKENNVKYMTEFTKNFPPKRTFITAELFEEKNSLTQIIKNDKTLSLMHKEDMFKIEIDDVLMSLKPSSYSNNEHYLLDEYSQIKVHIHKDFFLINCDKESIEGNCLEIMTIRDTNVSYGDEGRTKQEHIYNVDTYYNSLISESIIKNDYIIYDMTDIIQRNKKYYIKDVMNLVYFSTKQARAYHYKKHANNAFYHIQEINLPWNMFQFKYIGGIDA